MTERSKPTCPICDDRIYSNSVSVWCVRCGWGRNRSTPTIVLAYSSAWRELVAAFLSERPRRAP